MQFSVVNLQDVLSESTIFRLDAEFSHPKVLDAKEIIRAKNSVTIRTLEAKIIHPAEIKREYAEHGIQILLAQNIRDNYLDFSTKVFMPAATEEFLKRNKLEHGDIVLTRSGANYGQCAVYSGSPVNIFACADDLVIRIKEKAELPKYVATFLNTSFGKTLIESCKYGAAQPHIAPQALYDIPIYIPSNNFIDLIDNLITESENLKAESKLTYQDSQDFLLAKLGLGDWEPTQKLTYTKNYLDIVKAGRIDAEYYQPKYDEIIEAFKNYSGGADTLGNLATLNNRNFNPQDKVEYRYIELSNIASNGEITGCTTGEGQELPTRARRKVSTGDVIVSSIEGSLSSIGLVNEKYDGALCSTGFHVVKSECLNPETLLVLLKSVVGQMQLKKGCSGSILTAISPDELINIVLPKVEQSVQQQIQQKVTRSFALRESSKQLLAAAKRAVEIAIEKDEPAAIQYLKENTQDTAP